MEDPRETAAARPLGSGGLVAHHSDESDEENSFEGIVSSITSAATRGAASRLLTDDLEGYVAPPLPPTATTLKIIFDH